MARKLYTDVTLETPLKATYKSEQVDTYANDTDTVTIGSTEFIKITDGNGHDVKSVTTGKVGQLLLEPTDMELYYFDGTDPMTMGIEVVDEEPTPTQYTLTINPTPADATVVLTATGFTQVGNSITVDANTQVLVKITKEGYEEYSRWTTVLNNYISNIRLNGPFTLSDNVYVNYTILKDEPALLYSDENLSTQAEVSYIDGSTGQTKYKDALVDCEDAFLELKEIDGEYYAPIYVSPIIPAYDSQVTGALYIKLAESGDELYPETPLYFIVNNQAIASELTVTGVESEDPDPEEPEEDE